MPERFGVSSQALAVLLVNLGLLVGKISAQLQFSQGLVTNVVGSVGEKRVGAFGV